MTRKALGKGLEALIPRYPPEGRPITEEEKRTVPVDQILPNPRQPRKATDPAKMDELVRSVEKHGVLEPVLVRRIGETLELVAGERRLRAAQRAGIQEVPIILVDVTDKESLELALIENLQREDLNPVDEARAYLALTDEFGRTHEEIAAQVGKDRSTITNLLRLLRLTPDVLSSVAQGTLSVGHARALLMLDDPERQRLWARQIVQEGWSVRETERRLGERIEPKRPERKQSPEPSTRDPHLNRVEEAIRRQVGTEVRLHLNKRGGGRLEFVFGDREDLERVLDLLGVQVH